MYIPGRHAIELLKDLFVVLVCNAQAVIADFNAQVPSVTGRRYLDLRCRRTVFDCIVHEVVQDVRQMKAISANDRIDRIGIAMDDTMPLLKGNFDVPDRIVDDLMDVDLFLPETDIILVELRHLKYPLNLVFQPHILLLDDCTVVEESLGMIDDVRILQYLRRDGDRRNRSLELVGHVVDKIL